MCLVEDAGLRCVMASSRGRMFKSGFNFVRRASWWGDRRNGLIVHIKLTKYCASLPAISYRYRSLESTRGCLPPRRCAYELLRVHVNLPCMVVPYFTRAQACSHSSSHCRLRRASPTARPTRRARFLRGTRTPLRLPPRPCTPRAPEHMQ